MVFIKNFISLQDSIWIAKQCKSNEAVNRYVSEFLKGKDIDPKIRISSALSTLPAFDINSLKYNVEKIMNGDLTTKTDVTADVIQESATEMGKNTFNSFVKALTAIGFHVELTPIWSDGWLILFRKTFYNNRIKEVCHRFKSLTHMDHLTDDVDALYFGINNDMELVYGYSAGNTGKVVGRFKITNTFLSSIKASPNKSIKVLSEYLQNDTIPQLKMIISLKTVLKPYEPGKYIKRSDTSFKGDVVTISFNGIGNWENGKLVDYDKYKSSFIEFLSHTKWANKISVNLTPHDFWLDYKIKIK